MGDCMKLIRSSARSEKVLVREGQKLNVGIMRDGEKLKIKVEARDGFSSIESFNIFFENSDEVEAHIISLQNALLSLKGYER